MSVCRPARCLFTRASNLASRPRTATAVVECNSKSHSRSFHASPVYAKKNKSPFPSIKAEDMKRIQEMAETESPTYNEREKELLKRKYTPEQMAAIEAGEEAIDPVDLLWYGRDRTGDAMALRYRDELTKVQPLLDHKPRAELDPFANYDVRPKTEDEIVDDLAKFYVREHKRVEALGLEEESPEAEEEGKGFQIRHLEMLTSPRTFMHAESEEGYKALEDESYSIVAPEMRKLSELEGRDDNDGIKLKEEEEEGAVDPEEQGRQRIRLATGLSDAEVRRLRVKVLLSRRVVNQTRLGKIASMYYLTICGNGDGLLGIGEGKSTEPMDGRRQSILAAVKSMKPIQRYENRTIYGNIEGKVGAVELQLMTRPPGFGLRCQPLIFEMARAAGIHDLAARVGRSRNKMNTIKAAYEALLGQKLPEDIARARGRKMVDVRKVYYAGTVY
ncbi:mitochondrial 37S ribosomal protein uS5m [Phyllosticta citriasiana]|uniref:37S ribosomal protein S5 n=1 Tax=Phyllosticta citriasiana TaxID=595635 RepID=A0ABR1KH14_9PEZI